VSSFDEDNRIIKKSAYTKEEKEEVIEKIVNT
jgi:hypothetical protein